MTNYNRYLERMGCIYRPKCYDSSKKSKLNIGWKKPRVHGFSKFHEKSRFKLASIGCICPEWEQKGGCLFACGKGAGIG